MWVLGCKGPEGFYASIKAGCLICRHLWISFGRLPLSPETDAMVAEQEWWHPDPRTADDFSRLLEHLRMLSSVRYFGILSATAYVYNLRDDLLPSCRVKISPASPGLRSSSIFFSSFGTKPMLDTPIPQMEEIWELSFLVFRRMQLPSSGNLGCAPVLALTQSAGRSRRGKTSFQRDSSTSCRRTMEKMMR